MNRFGIQRPLSKNKCFLILSLLPVYFIVAGLFMQPIDGIFHGIVEIIREPDFLITDYFVIGGVGAAFINAGVLTLICIGIMYALDMNFDGHTITSTCLMFGFSLFGKNLLNIWMILLGVFLYAKYHKTTVKRYLYVGFYGTSLSPIVSQVMHIVNLPLPLRLLLCAATGIIIGFVLPPLSTHVHYSHKGYSLYNVGFAGGIIATVIVSILKSFGVTIESRLIWFTGQNQTFILLLSILFGTMIAYGILTDPMALEDYRSILRSYGLGGTDYYKSEGGAAVMINMGVNGLAAMLFVVMVGGDLNGPTIGGIFTVVGFSATGKHLRNILPVMAGVLIASEAKSWSITDPSAILALLLSTTLAPIAGEFGIIAGVIAGFLHSSVALNVGIVYGGMNLYNNGFAGGLVAMFLVPVIQSIRDRRARARGGLSL
ncbi:MULTISPECIES: DUF1576 domain-containing protein [unclassified Clostridium]|uniref:DUF1576 domain-containing protein n=1 Tax=unclassified Clostridium TaxID=2614128 RepID=UPI000E47E1AE|nr:MULTISPECIES: DUF1576 domain-containing protein [unclassified Clostridium]RHS83116.1 DUF1576 domain-containing protein [Clostridium sp. AM42-4]RHV89386.1 DUF1576 domain-containing protein [Clostridium sp. OF09-36]HBM46987.1 DUF1576 domain-containing protein [Lachnoclostridium sp.]